MATLAIRTGEPLYVVILRDPRATTLFKTWIQENRIQNAQVQENKMQLFDYNSLNQFIVSWNNGWGNLVIWDAWNRRHVDTQNR